MHRLVVLHRHNCRGHHSLCPHLPEHWLANLGRLRLDLHRRLHRRHRRHDTRPTSCRPRHRPLRTRLLRNSIAHIRRRRCCCVDNLRLLSGHFCVHACHRRDASTARLPQSPVHVHGVRHGLVSRLRPRRLPMVRPVGRLALSRFGWSRREEGRIRHWPCWTDCLRVPLLPRRSQVPLRAHSAQLPTPAGKHPRALGNMVGLYV